MMLLRVRYLRQRKRRDGAVYRWWEHPLYGGRRLPQEPQAAAIEAERLNGLARAGQLQPPSHRATAELEEGTVAWCIAKYRASERYRELAAATRRNYERWLIRYRDHFGALPVAEITRKVVRRLAQLLAGKPGERAVALSVLSAVLELARDEDLISENPCHKLRIKRGGRRDRVISRAELAALIRALRASRDPQARPAAVWLRLLYYTGQRAMDVIALGWDAWDGEVVKVRQSKTGRLVWVPAHRAVKLMLRQLKAEAATTRIVPAIGPDKVVYMRLHKAFLRAKARAGTRGAAGAMQVRDLRRSAVVALGEAGCTPQEVAAITGHSIDRTLHILETYMPRTQKMAKAAILARERAGNRVGRGSRTP